MGEEKEEMGEIHLFLGSIEYLEGQYFESMEQHQKAHKLIKNAKIWEVSAIETVKTLKKLNKFDDIESFLEKMIDCFEEISEQPSQQANRLQINHVLQTLV